MDLSHGETVYRGRAFAGAGLSVRGLPAAGVLAPGRGAAAAVASEANVSITSAEVYARARAFGFISGVGAAAAAPHSAPVPVTVPQMRPLSPEMLAAAAAAVAVLAPTSAAPLLRSPPPPSAGVEGGVSRPADATFFVPSTSVSKLATPQPRLCAPPSGSSPIDLVSSDDGAGGDGVRAKKKVPSSAVKRGTAGSRSDPGALLKLATRIRDIDARITPDMAAAVRVRLRSPRCERVLIAGGPQLAGAFDPAANPEQVLGKEGVWDVTREKFRCLWDHEWLNDEVKFIIRRVVVPLLLCLCVYTCAWL